MKVSPLTQIPCVRILNYESCMWTLNYVWTHFLPCSNAETHLRIKIFRPVVQKENTWWRNPKHDMKPAWKSDFSRHQFSGKICLSAPKKENVESPKRHQSTIMRASGCIMEGLYSLQHRWKKDRGQARIFVSMQERSLLLLTSYISVRNNGYIVLCTAKCNMFCVSYLSSTCVSGTNKIINAKKRPIRALESADLSLTDLNNCILSSTAAQLSI